MRCVLVIVLIIVYCEGVRECQVYMFLPMWALTNIASVPHIILMLWWWVRTGIAGESVCMYRGLGSLCCFDCHVKFCTSLMITVKTSMSYTLIIAPALSPFLPPPPLPNACC
jgi:hypothetical protein